MHLSIPLASLLGLFTVIHAMPLQDNEVNNGEMVRKTLRKRDYYDRYRDSRYYDDSYNRMGYNPSYFRSSYSPSRGYSMAASNRAYSPQYYTQPQYTGGYSEAEMQTFIANAAIAAASAVANSNSATPATQGTVAPAAGNDAYEVMLTTNDPNVLFGSSATANTQPASSPFTFSGDNTVATPVQANVGAPPRA